jgi:erythromycin esterase-like protein
MKTEQPSLVTIACLLSMILASCASQATPLLGGASASPRPSPAVGLASFRSDETSRRAIDSVGSEMAHARVVLLGEPDHYIHEKYAYDLLFIRFLVERGYRQIGFEMGRAQGKRVDTFVATGDESVLHVPADQTSDADNAKGTLAVHRDAAWLAADATERLAFFRALRAIDQARPAGTARLRVFGFDVDYHPAVAYRYTLDLMRDGKGDRVRQLRAHLEHRGAEDEHTHLADARRLAAESTEALASEVGPDVARELASAIRELEATVRFTKAAFANPSLDALMAAYAERERTMFWQVDEAVGGRDRAERTILIGHNMHLGRDSASIRFGDAEQGRAMWPSIGSHVARTYGERAYTIWLLYGGGTHGGHTCASAACPIAPPPGTIEVDLAKRGTRFLLPVRGRVRDELDADLRFIQNGELGSGRVGRQADLLVFTSAVRAPDEAGAAELLGN